MFLKRLLLRSGFFPPNFDAIRGRGVKVYGAEMSERSRNERRAILFVE